MPCEQCNKDEAEWFAYVPISQPDGKQNTCLCASCAMKSSAFCTVHMIPYSGFVDGTTICHKCLDALYLSVYTPELEEQLYHRNKVWQTQREFEEVAEIIQACADLRQTIFEKALFYLACQHSLRKHIPIETILSTLLKDGGVNVLLLEE